MKMDYSHHDVPEHTQEALNNYFFHGYEPGNFVTAVLCNDLMRATNSCDHINKKYLTDIAKWVMHNAPNMSWGSRQMVQDWLHDVDGARTKFVTACEKRAMWEALNE